MSKVYVTMTDDFMSGWGKAEGKTNKLIIECDSSEEAEVVFNNAKDRTEMKYVNVRHTKPSYNLNHVYPSWKTKEDYNRWFQPDAFKV